MGVIHVAAYSGAANVVRRLLCLKSDLARMTSDDSLGKRTPLHWAACSPDQDGALECARLLLDSGADVEATQLGGGTTPAILSALAGNESMLRLLLSRGARADAREDGESRRPLLHVAAAAGIRAAACVRTALEFGAPVDATTETVCTAAATPLVVCTCSSMLGVIMFLFLIAVRTHCSQQSRKQPDLRPNRRHPRRC